jgi:4-hydroxybenzoate polyprenyltransferase
MDREKPSGLKMYALYSKERFPVVPALIFAAALYCSSYFFGSMFSPLTPLSLADVILGSVLVFLITFHLRIFDEHKDKEKDAVAHPERMLSRGAITLADLRRLLYVLIALQIAVSICLGVNATIIWAVIFIYMLLMLKEFFVPGFLNRHMGLYLISHQVLVPITLLLGFFQREPTNVDMTAAAFYFAASLGSFITYEISRKTWPEEMEHELADSYTKFWGRGPAVLANQATALFSTAALAFVFIKTGSGMISPIVQAGLYAMFLVADMMFLKNPVKKNSKVVEGAGALYTIGFYLNSAITFYLSCKR